MRLPRQLTHLGDMQAGGEDLYVAGCRDLRFVVLARRAPGPGGLGQRVLGVGLVPVLLPVDGECPCGGTVASSLFLGLSMFLGPVSTPSNC